MTTLVPVERATISTMSPGDLVLDDTSGFVGGFFQIPKGARHAVDPNLEAFVVSHARQLKGFADLRTLTLKGVHNNRAAQALAPIAPRLALALAAGLRPRTGAVFVHAEKGRPRSPNPKGTKGRSCKMMIDP
jgi:hypothetical protein